MRKVFLDCGGHKATSVKMFHKYYPNAKQYEVHSFEANPHLHKFFKGEKTKLHKKAVWTHNGEVKFWIGRNALNQSATVIEGKTTGNFRKKPITVSCINFSQWIYDNFKQDDYIVLKLDIEGAEYDVLEQMIEEDSISYINALYIDWHYTKIPIDKSRHFTLLEALKDRDIKPLDWAAENNRIEGITND